MRTFFTLTIAVLILLPTLAIANQSDDLLINFCGLIYVGILYLISLTNVGKKGLKCIKKALENIDKILFNENKK